jgi:hypothetical protein
MSRDGLSCLAMGLVCLVFLAIAALLYVSNFKRLGKFTAAVKSKKSGWDTFIARTGLQWESRTPTYNPVMDKLVGSDVADKTGRVMGAYRGYRVVLANLTRNELHGHSLMVSSQTYYTTFHLTIQNPAGVSLRVLKKDGHRLECEPRESGLYLLDSSNMSGRLVMLPASFNIDIRQTDLTYIQNGLEEDGDRLYDVLEALCDLADVVGSYSAA